MVYRKIVKVLDLISTSKTKIKIAFSSKNKKQILPENSTCFPEGHAQLQTLLLLRLPHEIELYYAPVWNQCLSALQSGFASGMSLCSGHSFETKAGSLSGLAQSHVRVQMQASRIFRASTTLHPWHSCHSVSFHLWPFEHQ